MVLISSCSLFKFPQLLPYYFPKRIDAFYCEMDPESAICLGKPVGQRCTAGWTWKQNHDIYAMMDFTSE